MKLSRRHFLGTSLVLTAIPARLWAENASRDADIVLRYAVVSDVHFTSDPGCIQRKRLEKTLKFMETYAAGKPHPYFDAIVVAGDMTDHGHAAELTNFRDSLMGNLPKGTQAILCMGNHEFYGGEAHKKAGGSRKHWETIFSRAANTHTVVNGFHFIGISPDRGTCRNGDYTGSLEWLRRELETAAKEDPKRPIVVFQHYHVLDTVYGAREGDHWGIQDLHPILEEFPQVINYSGHSHYPSNDPRSAWQGKYTAFGTSTLSYFEMAGGIYQKFPAGHRNAAQAYFVEVFRDNSVHLKIYDAVTGGFFDMEYLVAESGAVEKYCFTEKRYDAETGSRPFWKDAEVAQGVNVSEVSQYTAALTFPQAHDPDHPSSFVGSYRISLSQRPSGQPDAAWEPAGELNPWSDYFHLPSKDTKMCVLEELEPGFDWKVEIRARNAFERLSENALTAEFRTLEDPDANAQDRNAPFPKADALNFQISENGAAQNTPFLESFPHQLETLGEPVISDGWACFDGQDDRFRIPFTPEGFARLKRRITMGVRFQFDAFRDGKAEDIFANTEFGGAAMELNHGKKVLEFWCHIAGRYQIVSAPIEPGSHTAYGTYDGKCIKLWIDGTLAAQKKASGILTYTSNPSARAYCIGSDISNHGGGSAFFRGKVRFAQIFTWALNEEQIRNLSQE